MWQPRIRILGLHSSPGRIRLCDLWRDDATMMWDKGCTAVGPGRQSARVRTGRRYERAAASKRSLPHYTLVCGIIDSEALLRAPGSRRWYGTSRCARDVGGVQETQSTGCVPLLRGFGLCVRTLMDREIGAGPGGYSCQRRPRRRDGRTELRHPFRSSIHSPPSLQSLGGRGCAYAKAVRADTLIDLRLLDPCYPTLGRASTVARNNGLCRESRTATCGADSSAARCSATGLA